MYRDEQLPEVAEAVIEVPKGSFIKRELHEGAQVGSESRVDFVSPVPSPFNYGFLPGHPGADGDPLDAVVLGARQKLGARVSMPIVGVVRFYDAGQVDDKLVLSGAPLTARQARKLASFFRLYAVARRLLNFRRGLTGPTRFVAVVDRKELKAFRNRR